MGGSLFQHFRDEVMGGCCLKASCPPAPPASSLPRLPVLSAPSPLPSQSVLEIVEIVEHVEPTALLKAKPVVRSCWLERDRA